jgi:hypothetical protein
MLMGILLAVVAGAAPVQAGLQDGLVAYFKLDEGRGTVAADASGNGNDGTLIGANLEWVPGYDGGSVLWSPPLAARSDERLEFPTTGMSVTAGTVCVWGYLSDPQPSTDGRYLFGHTAQPQWNSRIQVYMQQVPSGTQPTRFLHIGLGGAHAAKQNIKELPLREWVHVVLTWNNGAAVVYVNGVKATDFTYTGLTNLHPIANFGNDASSGPYEAFGGMLDEARAYNRAITAAEVTEIYQLPAAPRIKAWAPNPPDGARNVTLPLMSWKAVDAVTLHNVYVGTSPDLTEANLAGSRLPLKMFFYVPPLVPGTVYYWRVDGITADQKVYQGDVWSFMAQPTTAYDPSPTHGSNTAGLAPNLKWSAGKPPVMKHHVYFSTDLAAVKDGTAAADKGERPDPNFAPGVLEPLTTYYWRVDEIGAANAVSAGPVWAFTTMQPVDDMESYTDAEGSRIYQTWIDGWTNGTGSTVGYVQAPFAEQTIVHGGKQSMPLDYNNVKSPFYSEAEQTFATNQNWTANGVDTVVLYVRTKAGSKASPIYVALKDSSNKTGIVPAAATLVGAGRWTEWKIPLADFAAAGVNLARVKTLAVGVGNKANPVAGGTGLLFVDDICLAKPTPALP